LNMTCRYCKKDPKAFMLIPEGLEAVDVNQSPFACFDCAIREGILCVKHNRAHQCFGLGKHACWGCVDEARQHLAPHTERVLALVLKLLERLPKDLRVQFFEQGAIDVAPVGGGKGRICFEFLAREIAINKLDPGEFVKKYFLENREQGEIFALLKPFPRHVGA